MSLVEQLGIHLPDALTNAPFTKGAGHFEIVRTGALVNLPAVLIVAAITALCYVGIHQSARFNAIVVAIKVTVILLFIGFGIWVIDGANWQPFIPENTGQFGKFGWSGVVQAAGIIFFAYIGFDAVSTAAQEAKNPQRDMPIGILGEPRRLHRALRRRRRRCSPAWCPTPSSTRRPRSRSRSTGTRSSAGSPGWIKLGAIAGMTSVMLVMLLGQPRIFYAMSRDGLLPPLFRQVHPTHKTPYVGTLITGALAALIGGLFPVTILGELVSIGTLLAFTTVCIGVLVLRYTRPDLPRPFKVPAPWFVCIAGALVCTGHDGVAAAGHLGCDSRVDRDRLRDLLLLRVPAQRTAQGRPLRPRDRRQARRFGGVPPAARSSRRVAHSDATTPPPSVPRMMPSETRFGTWKWLTSSIFTPTNARISTRLYLQVAEHRHQARDREIQRAQAEDGERVRREDQERVARHRQDRRDRVHREHHVGQLHHDQRDEQRRGVQLPVAAHEEARAVAVRSVTGMKRRTSRAGKLAPKSRSSLVVAQHPQRRDAAGSPRTRRTSSRTGSAAPRR